MYRTLAKGIQRQRDRGTITDKDGRRRGPKKGTPKVSLHKLLDAAAAATQAATLRGFRERNS